MNDERIVAGEEVDRVAVGRLAHQSGAAAGEAQAHGRECVRQARERAEATVKQARFDIASEAAAARQNLLETSAALGEQIATTVLSGRTR